MSRSIEQAAERPKQWRKKRWNEHEQKEDKDHVQWNRSETQTKWNMDRWRTAGRGRWIHVFRKSADTRKWDGQRNWWEDNISLEEIWTVQHFLERLKDGNVPEKENHGYHHTASNDMWSRDLVTYQPPEIEAGRHSKKYGESNTGRHKER